MTLGHLATLPHIVDATKDVILIDQQVHGSVQITAALLAAQQTKIVPFLNSHLQKLPELIEKYSTTHENIFIFIDGLYSMSGLLTQAEFFSELVRKYPKVRLYVDDAHGIGIFGNKGEGSYMSQVGDHERLLIAGSTSKGLGAEGGFVAYESEEQKRWVMGTGCFFVGPAHPATMEALVESLKISIGDEGRTLRENLKKKITYFNNTCSSLGLPLLHPNDSPIKFIGVKYEDMGGQLLKNMIDKGFYINGCSYPNVSMGRAGLRITLTNHLTLLDIDSLLTTLKSEMDTLLEKHRLSYQDIFRAFKIAA